MLKIRPGFLMRWRLNLFFAFAAFFCTLGCAAAVSAEWVKEYAGPANGDDYSTAIAVDGGGNVYVTGHSDGISTSLDSDYATIKYSANGSREWVARYDGPASDSDSPTGIAVDGDGNVYVTGRSSAVVSEFEGDYDFATVKYDTDGNQKWVTRYGTLEGIHDIPAGIAVDGLGNVYVAGGSTGDTFCLNSTVIKYDADGNCIWTRRFDGGAYAIALDDSANVYVTGTVTIKYDSDGNRKWVTRSSGETSSIALDDTGNVYVAGQIKRTSSGYDYLIVKYDANGSRKWVKRYNGPANGSDFAHAIALDGAGNVYVTGVSEGTSSGEDYATVKYDANGNRKWVKRYNGPANGGDSASAIALDGKGNVYVTGWSDSDSSGKTHDCATINYDENGNQKWVRRYEQASGSSMVVGGGGNLYVTGTTLTTTGLEHYLTIKYDAGGN